MYNDSIAKIHKAMLEISTQLGELENLELIDIKKNATRCERCGGDSSIYNSREMEDKRIRYRRCKECGKEWKTVEVVYYG